MMKKKKEILIRTNAIPPAQPAEEEEGEDEDSEEDFD